MCFSSRLINATRILLWGVQSAVFSPRQSMQTLFFRVGYESNREIKKAT